MKVTIENASLVVGGICLTVAFEGTILGKFDRTFTYDSNTFNLTLIRDQLTRIATEYKNREAQFSLAKDSIIGTIIEV